MFRNMADPFLQKAYDRRLKVVVFSGKHYFIYVIFYCSLDCSLVEIITLLSEAVKVKKILLPIAGIFYQMISGIFSRILLLFHFRRPRFYLPDTIGPLEFLIWLKFEVVNIYRP